MSDQIPSKSHALRFSELAGILFTAVDKIPTQIGCRGQEVMQANTLQGRATREQRWLFSLSPVWNCSGEGPNWLPCLPHPCLDPPGAQQARPGS